MRIALMLMFAALAAPAAAQAPAPAAPATATNPLVGLPVRGARDELLGHVAQVIVGRDGVPVQVLVRPRGVRPSGPKPLPLAVLQRQGRGLSTAITRREFEAIPAAEPAPR